MSNLTDGEWQNPTNPMRIITSTSRCWYTHIVYAVRIDKGGLSYLTINGLLYTHNEIGYAETLIGGEWLKMTRREKALDR